MRRIWLLLAFALLPLTAVAQNDDRSFLTAFLEDNLSDIGRSVTIAGFQGALSSRATMTQMTIADGQGIWITLNDVALEWNRAALLGGRIEINALTAAEIVVNRAPVSEATATAPEAKGFSLPELPVSVEIGRIAADKITLEAPVLGTPLQGSLEAALTLAGGEGTASLTLLRTDDGPKGRVTLAASYANATGQLAIDLAAHEAAGGVAATLLGLPGAPAVDLTIKGEGPIADYAADLRLASDGVERLAGRVTLLARSEEGQRFSANLAGDLAPLFAPAYAEFFGPMVQLQTAGTRSAEGRLDLSQFSLRSNALVLDGNLVLAADGLPELVALQGRLGLADGTPVRLPSTSPVATYVTSADLTLAFDATKGDGWQGSADILGLKRADFTAEALRLVGSGQISRSAAGQTVDGTLRFDALGLAPTDAGLAQALGPTLNGTAAFNWAQGDGVINLTQLTLAGAGYALTADGRMDGLTSGFAVSGKVQAQIDDLARLAQLSGRPLAGQGVVQVSGSASLLGGAFDLLGNVEASNLQLGQTQFDTLLRGTSRIVASVRRDETGTEIRNLDLTASTLTASAKGRLTSAGSDISADLDFSDLSALGKPYGGALNGRATFSGTPDAGTLTLTGIGQHLTVGQAETDAVLKGASRITLQADTDSAGITLQSLRVSTTALQASAKGRLAMAGSDISADLDFSDLSALGNGYRGTLTAKGSFTGTQADAAITLDARGSNLGLGQAQLDPVLRGQSTLALALVLKDGKVQINRARLANPQLVAEATGTASGDQRNVTLDARLVNLALLLPDFPGALAVTGTAVQDAGGTTLNLQGTGPGQIAASVTGRIAPDYRQADLRLAGSAQAGLANVFIAPRIVSGPVQFDLRLNGPMALRSLSGRIALAQGRISDTSLPFGLQDVTASADLAAGRAQIAAEAAVTSGGRLAMRGGISMTAPYDSDLAVQVQNAILKDPQLYQTRANGTLTLRGPLAGGARIAGAIALAETELQIPSTGLGSLGSLPDLRHVNEPATVRATRARAGLLAGEGAGSGGTGPGRAYPLDLRISAPNRVFIRGRGLDAELGGSLRLGGTTVAVVPSGAFDLIRGRLDILGKRLDLSEALLRLEGDFVPYVRILASNESDGIISSVLIEGPASAPEVSFVSSPELPQEEVLARLLFGRDLTALSAFQAAQLAGAVATLAGKGGEGIVGKLRKGFGLDDLDVVTSDTGGAAVKAGKYLGKNLYTEVTVGQQGQSDISLNLDISRSITLRGRSGSDGTTSLGVFIEKDY